jgi:hypothetical protein
MCLYSLSSSDPNIRKAKVGETLTKGEYSGHGCFAGDDGRMACIKHGTELVIDKVRFFETTLKYFPDMKQFHNKTNLTVTFVSMTRSRYGRHYAADGIQLSPTHTISLVYLKDGVTARIPRKVRKDAGTKKPRNLTKVLGLDQIKADIPVETVKVS